ncbi:MAG: hypothetical protein Q8N14_05605 [Candidatus Omnitrophota bacterium]|nr:hypothetical protein [Candidatus Omnitrophota bacterium]
MRKLIYLLGLAMLMSGCATTSIKPTIVVMHENSSYAQNKYGEVDVTKCQDEISTARLSPINKPGNIVIDSFVLSPDNQEIVIAAIVWEKMLTRLKDGYSLLEYFPRYHYVQEKDGQGIANQWREESKKETGLAIDELGQCIYATKREFYIFDLKLKTWTKLDWQKGERLFKEYSGTALIARATSSPSSPDKAIAPDGVKIISKKIYKEGKVHFFTLEGYAYAFCIEASCVNGEKKGVFNMKFDEFQNWKIQWSRDSKFVLVLDSTGDKWQNKFFILRFSTEEN